jgi:ADP-dependent NAD(P)H-hydrate dehydratase / NAD(P)H-hydrate epimerase
MKILTSEQIKSVDASTVSSEGILSIDLMERAARACADRILKLRKDEQEVHVFCGMGNNGGDGLAITRLLSEKKIPCQAFIVRYSDNFSADAQANFNRLKEQFPASIHEINPDEDLKLPGNAIAVDAIFGTGLNKTVTGPAAEIIKKINANYSRIISIDMPGGLFADKSPEGDAIIRSALTLTFQLPKLSLLLPSVQEYAPEFEILDIGLSDKAIEAQHSPYFYLTAADVASLLKPRNKFSHKGTFGHALLLAGSSGKSGAAVIAAKACLRSGAGLLTVHSNESTLSALQSHLPEAMSSRDWNADRITELHNPAEYDAIAFGPGADKHEDTQQVLKKLLHYYSGNLVIDADGLNILSENKTWLEFLPPATILTPHPGEFERLTGRQENDFERLEVLKQFSLRHNCIVVLKGAHTTIAMPDGNLFFNSTGNPGLAKGGSGDALTGIILGLLARGYNAPQAALIGVFIHGYAADLAIKKSSVESLLISDVIEKLPGAFKMLEKVREHDLA